VVASPASVPADQVPASGVPVSGSVSTVTVTLLDSLGQPLTGKTVILTEANGPPAQIVAGSIAVTNQAGQATYSVISTNPGVATFDLYDYTDDVNDVASAQVTFLGPSPSQSTVVGSPASVPANGTDSTVTVTLLDSLGQPLTGKTVSLAPGGTVHAVISPAQATTNANGQATFTVSDQTAEVVNLFLDDVTDGVNSVASAQVAFVAPGLSDVAVGTGTAASATSTAAGGSITATAAGGTAQDGVVVGQYSSNPEAGLQTSTGAAFDVMLAQPSGYSQVTVHDCDLNGGNGVSWWNGTAWQAITPAPAFSAGPPACVTFTLSATSSPTLAQLTGTVFAATLTNAPQAIIFNAPAAGTVGTSATLTATGGASGNPVVFTVDSSSGAGVCNVSGTNGTTVNYTAAGTCVIDANQAGNASYLAAPQVQGTITVNQAPAFVMDSPALTAVAGQEYSYTFAASGTPAPTYALGGGAPSWLSVSASTGQVTGTPPTGTTSFSYSVTATNTAGTATAGPFTVTVSKATTNADISVAMTCPSGLTVGGTGTCKLIVANAGPATASKVVAAVLVPAALSEVSCTASCTRHGNVFTWALGTLASGASTSFTITVKASKAGTALVLAVAASQNPDPKPLNNIAISLIAVTK
jgi:hypothetical protein